jgi:hypothetical protein
VLARVWSGQFSHPAGRIIAGTTILEACLPSHFWGFLVFFLTILGFELRTLCSSTTWATPLGLFLFLFFCFSYFSDRVSRFCPGLASDHDPSTCGLPCSWDHRNVPPWLSCWLKWSLANFFAQASLKLQAPWSLPPILLGFHTWSTTSGTITS